MRSGPIPQLSVSTLISAAKNHWFAAGVVMFLTLALAVVAMVILPRKYHSDAMVFVKLGRETVSLDPTATTGSTISVLDTRDNEINSIRDMLYSRGIMEKVVDRIGPDVILGDAELTDEVLTDNFVPGTDYYESPRQQAIRELSDNTGVVTSRKSSVLILTADSSSPELAQRILKEYLEVYQLLHTDAHQDTKSSKFFKEQVEILQIQWQESMKALQIAKEDAGVVSVAGAKDNLSLQTFEAETALMSVTSRLSSTAAKVKNFEATVKRNPLDQQSVRGDYLEARNDVLSLTAEKEAIEASLKSMLARAAKLNRNEVIIGALEQEAQIAAAKFAQYQESYEQTRIEDALHNNNFTNVQVVQDPSFDPRPISPRKSLIGMAGLVAGGSGAVLLAVFLELFFTPSRPEDGDGELVPEPDYPDNDEFSALAAVENTREVVDTVNG